MPRARLHSAARRPLRRRSHLSAARRSPAGALRAHMGAHHQGAGARAARLALSAGRQLLHVGDGHRDRAAAPPGVHRLPIVDPRPGRLRAASLSGAQDRLQLHPGRLQGSRHRPLHRVAVEPHPRLQGHVPVLSGQGLLQRSVGPALRLGDGARAPALLDQHLPVLEARAPVSLRRPQRRDQHAARQRELDGGARSLRLLAALRRRHRQAMAHLLRGPIRHRVLRQRPRVPRHGRLQPRARGDDADPGGVGRQSADGPQAARLLRVPRLPHGAVGRPSGHGLLRRPPDRRHARPQRLAASTLLPDQGRPRRHVLGSGRAAGAGGAHPAQVAAAARQDAADRPGEGPHHLGRRVEGRDFVEQPVRDLAQAHADPRLRPAAAEAASGGEEIERRALGSAAGIRLHAGEPEAPDEAHGRAGPGGRRLHGQRHADLGAVVEVEAPAHLLQAELRAGDEPADQLDPRGARHEPRVVHRAAPQHSRPGRHLQAEAARGLSADPDQRGSGARAPDRRGEGQRVLLDHDRHHLSGG